MKVILKPGGFVVVGTLVVLGVFGAVKVLSPRPEPSTSSASPQAKPPVSVSGQKPLTGASLIDPTRQGWSLATQKPAAATMKLQVSPELPAGSQHSLHLEVTAVDPNKYWCAQLLKKVPQAVEGNHNLTVQFWGRSVKKTAVYVVFEEGLSPHTAELQKNVRLTPEWRQYQFPFRTTKDHTDTHANFCIKAGLEVGEIEIANMHVVDNGKAS
jgi:hypothetical protein